MEDSEALQLILKSLYWPVYTLGLCRSKTVAEICDIAEIYLGVHTQCGVASSIPQTGKEHTEL